MSETTTRKPCGCIYRSEDAEHTANNFRIPIPFSPNNRNADMETFKPLVEQAAFWVHIDAMLRLFWSLFGAVMIVAAIVTATVVARAILRSTTGKNSK